MPLKYLDRFACNSNKIIQIRDDITITTQVSQNVHTCYRCYMRKLKTFTRIISVGAYSSKLFCQVQSMPRTSGCSKCTLRTLAKGLACNAYVMQHRHTHTHTHTHATKKLSNQKFFSFYNALYREGCKPTYLCSLYRACAVRANGGGQTHKQMDKHYIRWYLFY